MDPKARESRSLKNLIKEKRAILNLLSLGLNWTVISFCWYIMGFYVHYFHGNIYINGMLLGLADVFANILTRSIQFFSPTSKIFLLSFISVSLTSVVYLLFQSHYFMVPITIVLMRAGLTIGFSLSYYGIPEFF